nr:RING finger and transmembrane domain-containing protein 2 isoform X1 [Tanacetum cinerariifolium]
MEQSSSSDHHPHPRRFLLFNFIRAPVSTSLNYMGILHTGNDLSDMRDDSSSDQVSIRIAARWAEQILPFSMLFFVVFIRQHLQGFFVTIWIAAFMFKSNDILCNQTALKGERKISVLVSLSLLFTLHVAAVYWLFGKEDVIYPLVMLPPKTVPPFWQAIFIIFVNDILARQASMVLKCFLLMY